ERESQRQKVQSTSDDERNDREEPPDEESEYQPSDEGSDCGTDGVVKNRRKVKARRGNPKSASRRR
ncbi:RPL18B, partial [Symbiodinium sp. CCMP2456]